MTDLDQWRKSGEHLPTFMRDFHDQKDLFKTMEGVCERSRAKHGDHHLNLSWIDAHIYTVDIFLWVMAGHGYTLQRSRKRGVTFRDICEFVKSPRDRSLALLQSLFNQGTTT